MSGNPPCAGVGRQADPPLFRLLCCCVLVVGTAAHAAPVPIRWDLALVHGLEVSSQSLGIRDRIRVVTLGTSGCTPRAARLSTLNPESGLRADEALSIQGRSITFEIEGFARAAGLLRIDCLERERNGGPPKTFTLELEPGNAR